MLHRRNMYFFFYQHRLIRMHPHPILPAPTGRRLRPPCLVIYNWQGSTNSLCKHQPTLAAPNHPYFLNLNNFCIKSLLHLSLLLWFKMFSDLDCRDSLFSQHSSLFIYSSKRCESDTLCPLVLNHHTSLFNLTIIIDYYFYCEGFL